MEEVLTGKRFLRAYDFKDLRGERFGKWTAIEFDKRENKTTYWICRCDCGTEKSQPTKILRSGQSTQCKWCSNRKNGDLTGKRFGKWTVLSYVEKAKWRCRCDCGTEKNVYSSNLYGKDGKGSTQCKQCFVKQQKSRKVTHGFASKHSEFYPLYHKYKGMKERCYNDKCLHYSSYGGRGIKICDEWLDDIAEFVRWCSANGWKNGLQIDRINVNGHYEPSNCRFVTPKINSNNKRNTVRATYNGETKTLDEWAKTLKVNRDGLHHHLSKQPDYKKTPKKPSIKPIAQAEQLMLF